MLGLREITIQSQYSASETLEKLKPHVWSMANPDIHAPLTGSLQNRRMKLRRSIGEGSDTFSRQYGIVIFEGSIEEMDGRSTISGRCRLNRFVRAFYFLMMVLALPIIISDKWWMYFVWCLGLSLMLITALGLSSDDADYIEQKIQEAIR